MQKISLSIFSEELLMEQTGAGPTWCTCCWSLRLGRGAPCEGGITRVAPHPSHSLKTPAGFPRQHFLREGVPWGLVTPAVLLAPSSLQPWGVAHCHPFPRVKLRAKPGEICLFWKVSLSQSLISAKRTHPNLPLLLLYLLRLQLTTPALGVGNSVIRALTLFWILKISCFYSCQTQSFTSAPPAAVLLWADCYSWAGKCQHCFAWHQQYWLPRQGGCFCIWDQSSPVFCLWYSLLSEKKCCITLSLFSKRVRSCSVTLSRDLSCLVSSLELDLLITWSLLKARPKYFRSQRGQHASLWVSMGMLFSSCIWIDCWSWHLLTAVYKLVASHNL